MRQASERIGRVRYTIVAILFAVTIVNYADRAILAITAPVLSKDIGINPLELGIVFSAFGWAYCAAQVPGGWLLDRFGTKRVYLAGILLWSIFTAAQGAVAGLAGAAAIATLFALRFLVGLAEAPSFPGNARMVAAWFPASERGTASAIFNSAQYFATVLFAPIMAWITYAFGWPSTFIFMGGIGLLVAAGWWGFAHEPRHHPRIGNAELTFIVEGGGLVDMDSAARPARAKGDTLRALRGLLGHRSLWGLYLGQFAINTLTYFFITWFPVYLVEERGLSLISAGLFASAPAICGFLGGLAGGLWSDWLLRRGFSLTAARKIPIVTGMLISISIIFCNYTDSLALVLVFMSLAFFGKGVGALGWAVVADMAPREFAGLSGGLFNMFGNLSSILTPIVIGAILHTTGSFKLALVFVAANALLAAVSFVVVVGPIHRLGAGEETQA